MAKQSHDKALNLKSHYSYTAAKNSVLYLYLSYPSKSKDIRNLVKKKKSDRNLMYFSCQIAALKANFLV